MDLGLRGRVALVAASSKGLGRAAAEALAAEGAHLALCARGEPALAAAAADLASRHAVEVFHRALDLTDYAAVQSFVRDAAGRFGRLDICVANCGGPPSKNFLSLSIEEWRAAVDMNLMSAVYLAKETLPYMQRQQWGRFVAITSVAVKQPLDGLLLSNSVRAAVAGLTKSLANEFGKDNILVYNVCPGYTLTDRLKELAGTVALAQGIRQEEAYARWASLAPLGRIGRPEEFGAFVAFLCSEKSSYVTGVSIAIDGGLAKGLL
jgi:3-oxoacyl-[acyl-carrier protein] reductase